MTLVACACSDTCVLRTHRLAARADARSTARLASALRFAPAARTSSLPPVGRLFAPRTTGRAAMKRRLT